MSNIDVDFAQDDEVGLFTENMVAADDAANGDKTLQQDYTMLSQNVDARKQYITFTIDKEEYGMSILSVQEIRGWMKTTPLPNMPSFVRGVTNLRGHIVPVFDMRARFCGKLTDITDRHVVVMVQIDGRTLGLLVDAISDIITIEEGQIQVPPAGELTIDAQYLDGLATVGERMVAFVNIHKLFDTQVIKTLTDAVKSA